MNIRLAIAAVTAVWFVSSSASQTLGLRGNGSDCYLASQLVTNQMLLSNEAVRREAQIYKLVMLDSDVPRFLRTLHPVNVTNVFEGKTNSGTFFVTPDYLSLGTDDDHLLMPMTPATAQRIADELACFLPTRRMVDEIHAAAEVKLEPQPIPPSPAMTTLPVFIAHDGIVRTQRLATLKSHPLGALVAGHKKDVVISAKLAGLTNKVAIYGWHPTNGVAIQPLYTGHSANWADYSHGIRLVWHLMFVNGEPRNIASVLADPKLCRLISDEGVVTNSRYATGVSSSAPLWPDDFFASPAFGERICELNMGLEVRVQINAPSPETFSTNKPVKLIFYALPNGNTIEMTAGRATTSADDWHYNIQHIAAQTRFLRNLLTNETIVVAYLENSLKSWPAWRRKHGDSEIFQITERVKRMFPGHPIRTVLTGHSGGGSLTFGYLNSIGGFPPEMERVAFLDSNYAYETTNHLGKFVDWLKRSPSNNLCILAYNDSYALLNGKPFVTNGTWKLSHKMLDDLGEKFSFDCRTNGNLRTCSAKDGKLQFLLLENPERKVLHTVQVERNGFIHAMLTGTPWEGKGYEYLGERAYTNWLSGR